jgi:hypothetical protein
MLRRVAISFLLCTAPAISPSAAADLAPGSLRAESLIVPQPDGAIGVAIDENAFGILSTLAVEPNVIAIAKRPDTRCGARHHGGSAVYRC